VPVFSYTVLAGARVNITHFPGAVYDKMNRQWVSKVCLSAADLAFNFDPIYQACMTFRNFILPWMLSTYKPGIQVTTKALAKEEGRRGMRSRSGGGVVSGFRSLRVEAN
jgi:hypothetical protein